VHDRLVLNFQANTRIENSSQTQLDYSVIKRKDTNLCETHNVYMCLKEENMYSIHVDKHTLTVELCGTNLVEKETQTEMFDTSNAELFTENEFAFFESDGVSTQTLFIVH